MKTKSYPSFTLHICVFISFCLYFFLSSVRFIVSFSWKHFNYKNKCFSNAYEIKPRIVYNIYIMSWEYIAFFHTHHPKNGVWDPCIYSLTKSCPSTPLYICQYSFLTSFPPLLSSFLSFWLSVCLSFRMEIINEIWEWAWHIIRWFKNLVLTSSSRWM